MKKLAIFVEGLTEQILVRQMLQAVLDRKRIAIQSVKITGGHNVRMSFTVLRAAHVERQTEYYVLVYDCGGETNVKGYMMAHRQKLVGNGYSMILGLRDVYPNFQREDVPKLKRGLNYKLPQKGARTQIHLAVMETEAWFLGEYRHLRKLSRKLSPEFVEKQMGFNPKTDNMEERDRPAEDLKAIYRLVGHDYTKKRDRLNAVVSKLDFSYFTHGLADRMESLGAFVEGLESFFMESF
ncbi:MAG: hypothetical protein CSA96_09095 [Bacteroidetes bacterium]|nr:MAG: hypothetical protein CSA96_09095 [Bacteroidota bacterium]